MKNFIKTNTQAHLIGLIFLGLAAVISAGCSTRAETVKPATANAPVAQKEAPTPAPTTTAAPTQTPGASRISEDSFSEPGHELGPGYYPSREQKKSSVSITKASFEKLENGMTLAQVEKLLGDEGMLVSMMDVNGRKTQIYKWSTDDFSSYIDVTIENGKLVDKKEKGLK